MNIIVLSPAYGRDYKSAKEVKAALLSGKDFRIESIGPNAGRYCSLRDFPVGQVLNVRYRGLRQVLSITVTSEMKNGSPA